MTETVAVVGGTGDLGLGLAARLAGSYRVLIGSREEGRAAEAAARASSLSGSSVEGRTNDDAAAVADIIVLAIPDLPSDQMLLSLKPRVAGKLVISPIVPMDFRDGLFVSRASEASAAEKVSSVVETRVAAAFHQVPAARLLEVGQPLDYDVLVAADTREIYAEAARLVSKVSRLRPLHAGPLRCSRTLEMLTPTLLNVGKLNRIKNPSIRVV